MKADGLDLEGSNGKGGKECGNHRRKVNGRKGVGRCERGRIIGEKAMEGRGWGGGLLYGMIKGAKGVEGRGGLGRRK